MPMVSHTTTAAWRHAALAAASSLAFLAPAPSLAAPAPRALTLATPGTELRGVQFWKLSDDGKRMFFQTDENLLPADNDSVVDVYERFSGQTRLVSGGTAGTNATLEVITPDGTRALFTTTESLDAADTDATLDLYERHAGGVLRLITPGVQQPFDVAISDDGTRVFFATEEALLPGDTDTATDFYERRSTGDLTLVTPGTQNTDTGLGGISSDGTRFRFITDEPLLPLDTDTARDLYERTSAGSLRLISTGGANEDIDGFAASADGTRVYFETREAIPGTGDVDDGLDIYEREPSGGLRLVTMPDSAPFDAERIIHVSRDGRRVTFPTLRPALPADTNSVRDLYQRTDAGLRLISAGGDGPAEDAGLPSASDDGTVVYFRTEVAVPGTGDTDTSADLYRRGADESVALVSGGNQNIPVTAHAASADGSRIFFSTNENIGATDEDGLRDVYEGAPGAAPRLLSTGVFATGQAVTFGGASRDGSRVFFSTGEALVGTGDFDVHTDVYERAWTSPTFDAPPQIGGTPQPRQTLTCATQVTADGATVSLQWLRGDQPIGATGATYAVLASDVGADLACRATATNVIGSAQSTSAAVTVQALPVVDAPAPPASPSPPLSQPVPSPGPSPSPPPPLAPGIDAAGPAVALTPATCPRKAKSKKACAGYRKTRAAWRTLRFTATDPSGVAAVRVGVVRQAGKRCFALRGKRFASQRCAKARTQSQPVKPRNGKFALALGGLQAGKHTIRIVATDAAGNQTSFTTTLSIRK